MQTAIKDTIARSRYAVATPWEDVGVKEKIPYLEKLNEKIFSLDNRVRKVQAYLQDSTSHVLFCNSEGVSYYDYRPMVSFMALNRIAVRSTTSRAITSTTSSVINSNPLR